MKSNSLRWMKITLLLAAVYNLIWGAIVVLWPTPTIEWLGLTGFSHPQIWQCLGMVIGVYGIGYACAALNPLRHWPIVLVGFLGKLFGPIGFLISALSNELPWRFGLLNLTNDLVWLIPFALILRASYKDKAWHTEC